jgi:hypothetical protein
MASDSLTSPRDRQFAFGLTSVDVEEFREIIESECGETLSLEEAWSRAIEVLALCRMLLGPIPEDPLAVQTSSGLVSSP